VLGGCEVDVPFCGCVSVAGRFWKLIDLLNNY